MHPHNINIVTGTFHSEVRKACEVIQNGGILIYPTDTLWAVGCDATNETAIAKLYQIKRRPATKPVILLVGSLKQAESFVEHIPNTAKQIIKTAKRPITIVYPKAKNIPQVAKAHNGSIAIRIPKNRFLKSLLKMLGQPIISTSANISGHKPPTNFQEITAEMLKHADHIVNLKRNSRKQNKPSAILEINANGQIKIIRK